MNTPLFPAPRPIPVVLSKTFTKFAIQRGIYAKYRPAKRVACDECVARCHETRDEPPGRQAPLPRGARVSRRGIGETLRLCTAHADLWKALDERLVAQ